MKLSNIDCFIFDMDGTIYSGDHLFGGVVELFNYFRLHNINFYFLTNNSSKTGYNYVNKLIRLGISFIKKEQIITSGDITIDYLKRCKYKKIYLVATPELESQFINAGIELVSSKNQSIDCVVVGFDTTFNYHKGEIATHYLRKHIPFISTNEDLVCPIENNEFIPDCGSLTSLLEKASMRKAKYLGKPNIETVDYLLDCIKTKKENLAIVGDRLYTDIATGFFNGFTSIAMLTGEFRIEDLNSSIVKPTYIFDNIKGLLNQILFEKLEI